MNEEEKTTALNNALIKEKELVIYLDSHREVSTKKYTTQRKLRYLRTTIDKMKNGTATQYHYSYWLRNGV